MDSYFGTEDRELEECFIKRHGSMPEKRNLVYLLLRRDRLYGDGRSRCVAVTEDLGVAEQWRTGGAPEDGRTWEAVKRLDSMEAVLKEAGE